MDELSLYPSIEQYAAMRNSLVTMQVAGTAGTKAGVKKSKSKKAVGNVNDFTSFIQTVVVPFVKDKGKCFKEVLDNNEKSKYAKQAGFDIARSAINRHNRDADIVHSYMRMDLIAESSTCSNVLEYIDALVHELKPGEISIKEKRKSLPKSSFMVQFIKKKGMYTGDCTSYAECTKFAVQYINANKEKFCCITAEDIKQFSSSTIGPSVTSSQHIIVTETGDRETELNKKYEALIAKMEIELKNEYEGHLAKKERELKKMYEAQIAKKESELKKMYEAQIAKKESELKKMYEAQSTTRKTSMEKVTTTTVTTAGAKAKQSKKRNESSQTAGLSNIISVSQTDKNMAQSATLANRGSKKRKTLK